MKTLKIAHILALALIAILTLAACRSAAPDPVAITEADAGKTIELHPGDQLMVTLDGNITTGYTWENTLPDAAVLKQNGEAEFKAESDKIGAGGKITLKFDAVSAGQVNLKLVYHRPWEKDVQPINTYEVTVVVK